ncbi:hypothetical protein NT239_00860 [Chitinibacter sp. SCUT-21]|uniref:hypothetical protein n=1 Tax=Chitinibacter sp. SCUT-21 TaxID=2970891 RepID=UPI0035A59A12
MLRKGLQLLIICSLYSNGSYALTTDDDSKAETMVDRLLFISSTIDELCGEHFDVVWVDDRGINPPCMMSYSQSCSEAQGHHVNSCEVMMKALKD